MKRLPVFVDIAPTFKAGDPPPTGYLEWHEWARVQHKAGLRQRKCRFCGLWAYPQEQHEDCERKLKIADAAAVML